MDRKRFMPVANSIQDMLEMGDSLLLDVDLPYDSD
jgi:hypothetical protein